MNTKDIFCPCCGAKAGHGHSADCGLTGFLRATGATILVSGKPQATGGTPAITTLAAEGYETLAAVLARAFEQASSGKGKERHAGAGVPFERQPMATINMEQGSIDGFLYQARKKALEAKRLPAGRAQAELLGAINYLAGAVIALDTWAAGTLPQANETPGPLPYAGPDRRAAGGAN